MNRDILREAKIHEPALQKMGSFQKETLDEVKKAVGNYPVVVVGMKQNPFCKKIRKSLKEAKVDFHYLEYGSYWSGWKKRLSIKLWSGWPTFPQVFVNGTLVGGYEDTVRMLQDGSFQKLAPTRH